MVPHQASFKDELFGDTKNWRLAMFISHKTAQQASLTYSSNAAVSDWKTFLFSIPIELRSGWIHLAHTYNQNESGGTLRSYVNGNLVLTRASLALKVYGSEGAYVHLY